MRRALLWPLLLAAATGCSAKIEEIDPSKFACTDDLPLADGTLPCLERDWCLGQSCTPRLGCYIENGSHPGCDPERRCEDLRDVEACQRCDLHFNDQVAAVSCGPGVHTETSTRPADLTACDCPDGTACVAFSDGANSDAYPLYLLPPNTPAPTGRLGFTTDLPERRMCTRVCSSELDCPAAHTCRATVVVTASVLADPTSARSTIGSCWPELLTSTSTQADSDACFEHADCSFGTEPCRFSTLIVPDHPRVPAKDAWGTRYALISRCSFDAGGTLKNADAGCTEDTECKSGLCARGRCARPCNPALGIEACPSNRACRDTPIERKIPGRDVVYEDRAQICAEL